MRADEISRSCNMGNTCGYAADHAAKPMPTRTSTTVKGSLRRRVMARVIVAIKSRVITPPTRAATWTVGCIAGVQHLCTLKYLLSWVPRRRHQAATQVCYYHNVHARLPA